MFIDSCDLTSPVWETSRGSDTWYTFDAVCDRSSERSCLFGEVLGTEEVFGTEEWSDRDTTEVNIAAFPPNYALLFIGSATGTVSWLGATTAIGVGSFEAMLPVREGLFELFFRAVLCDMNEYEARFV